MRSPLAIIMIIFVLYTNRNWPSMIDNSIYVTPSLKFPLPVRNGREWRYHKEWPPDTIPLQTTTSIFSVFIQSWTNDHTVAGHWHSSREFWSQECDEIILSHSRTWLCSRQILLRFITQCCSQKIRIRQHLTSDWSSQFCYIYMYQHVYKPSEKSNWGWNLPFFLSAVKHSPAFQ